MKKMMKQILVIVISLFTMISFANAKSKGTELFQYNDKLEINKRINGTAFFAGNEVKVNEKINGIGFIAGEEININEEQDYLFLFGLNVDVDSDINNDIFIFGENVKVNKNIKRDAYVAGTTIVLNGSVDRNTYVYATTVEIKGKLNGNVYINATNIKIDEKAEIKGTIKYNDNALIEGLNNDIKTKTYSLKENYSIGEYVYSFITSYIGIVIVGLALVYMLEKVFKKSINEVKSRRDFANMLGKGLILLICVPIIGVTLLMTGIFSSLAIIVLIIYGLLIYLSEIFVAYLVAHYIDKKWLNKKLNSYILVILGLFIIRVLSIVPIIGGFISFVSLLLGLGILGNMILKIKN